MVEADADAVLVESYNRSTMLDAFQHPSVVERAKASNRVDRLPKDADAYSSGSPV